MKEISIIGALELALKQYIMIGVLTILGGFMIAVVVMIVLRYKEKKNYENDSLPTLVDVGLEEAEPEEEEDVDFGGVSAFDLEDDDNFKLDDVDSSSILEDAFRTTSYENESRDKKAKFKGFSKK